MKFMLINKKEINITIFIRKNKVSDILDLM